MTNDTSVDVQSTHTSTTRLQRGFTLIELVIVIAVLGVLSAIAVPQLTGFQDEAELNGEATVISSELGNAFATDLLNGNIASTGGSGVDWTSVGCDNSQLVSASPALSSSDYTIGTGLDEPNVPISVPSYDSSESQVSSRECEFGGTSN